jgi:hypothetical protein
LSSSSSSRVEGSGIPPSITHRLDSYFVRIKFSILASEGTWPGARLASQYLEDVSCGLLKLQNSINGGILVRLGVSPLDYTL